tara:strand:+ start:267 stop:527 length:261 start_codon:yes stop_codon:yes gene_type:complete
MTKDQIGDYLTEEELSGIKKMLTDLNAAKLKLADTIIESEKYKSVIKVIREKLHENERGLIEKYGKDASISLETGKVTQNPIKKEN